MLPVRVYYSADQRQGNYQIRIGKKRDMLWFKDYIKSDLRPLHPKIGHSTQEPERRYYIEYAHLEHMINDPRVDLKENYIWRENLP